MFLLGWRPSRSRLGEGEAFAWPIIYFAVFLRYCFVKANHCDVINDLVESLSPLVVEDATKLIFQSLMSITLVLELCRATQELSLEDMRNQPPAETAAPEQHRHSGLPNRCIQLSST